MIEPTPIVTYVGVDNPYEKVGYLQEAKDRSTQQFHNKDVFERYLELLLSDQLDIQEVVEDVMKNRSLHNARGAQLDMIGRILGQPRVLFDSVIIQYFGFAGATGASPYKSVSDTERVYGPYKSVSDTLLGVRELTDQEYRRLLKLQIIKNTSSATITAFADGIRLLFGIDSLDYQEDVPADYSEGAATITVSIGRDYNDPQKSVFPGLDELTLANRFLNRPIGVGILYQDPITLFADFQAQTYEQFIYGNDGLTIVTFEQMFDFSRPITADYVDSSGTTQTAAVDEPRFTYNPSTLEPEGLLFGQQDVLTHTWGLEANDSQGTIRIELTHDNTAATEAVMVVQGVDFKFVLFRDNTYWKVRVEYEGTQSYEMIISEYPTDSVVATISYSPNEVYFNIQDEDRRMSLVVDYGDTNVRGLDVQIGGDFTTNDAQTYTGFSGTVRNFMYLRPYIGDGLGTVVTDGMAITTQDYDRILTEFDATLVT